MKQKSFNKVLIILGVLTITGFIIVTFMPKKLVENQKETHVTYVMYKGSKIEVNEDEIISILDKYTSRRSIKNFFPYETDKVEIEINIFEGNNSRYILLGDNSLWYDSVERNPYIIKDSQELKKELIAVFKR